MGQVKNALLKRLENDSAFFETYWLAEENCSDPDLPQGDNGPGQLDSMPPKANYQYSQPSFDEAPF